VTLRGQPHRRRQQAQIEYVSASTRLVTLTIGGNDVGFAQIVKRCLFRRDCTEDPLAEKVRGRLAAIRARLAGAYRLIRERMDPRGYLLVAGYPRLFLPGPDAGCEKLISRKEAEWIDSLVIQGNAKAAKAVADATGSAGNVAYVDVTERFAGHELCSEEEWLHDLHFSLREGLNPFKDSYHPNKNGQRAYAEAFAGTLRRPAIHAALTPLRPID
jgi:lysophospholipase L1-like esterase